MMTEQAEKLAMKPQDIRNWALEDAAKIADRYEQPDIAHDIRAMIKATPPDDVRLAEIVLQLELGNLSVQGTAPEINKLLRLHREAAAIIRKLAAAYQAGFDDARERAGKVADDHTPDKRENTLAAHVTGRTIASAIRAIKPGDADGRKGS